MSEELGRPEYERIFTKDPASPPTKRSEALRHALDIRKFEIELYWKRATYFWTFIAASLVGYTAVLNSSQLEPAKSDSLVILSTLGLVFAFGWYFANRGSKQWQENWENHVDFLENDVIGPLYKTVTRRLEPKGIGRLLHPLISPGNFSVTKINQLLSVYVISLFGLLLYFSLQIDFSASIRWRYVVEVGFAATVVLSMASLARTSEADHRLRATLREPQIRWDPTGQEQP